MARRRRGIPVPDELKLRGLIFQSRRLRAACRDYRLRQEFITPYAPQQNGIVPSSSPGVWRE
jgi:transposase InsO family protein